MKEEITELRRESEGVRGEMKSVEDQNALLQEQLIKEMVVEVGGSLKKGKSKRGERRRGGCTGQQKATPREAGRWERGCTGHARGGAGDGRPSSGTAPGGRLRG